MARLQDSPRWLRIAVWAVGALAYFAAIMSRTSLSATASIASDRFDLSSSDLAAFGILQILVYALSQIPAGMLIDRLGARTVVLAGIVIVAISQLAVGFGGSFGVLLAARAVAGFGDALVFPSAVRLTAVALPTRWVPTGTQLMGVLGTFGMIASATPLLLLVDAAGWPAGYAITAAFTGVVAMIAFGILARMGPDPSRTASGESLGSVLRGTAESMRAPGAWLAFTVHLVTGTAFTAFVVTWGPLFLEHGAGLDAAGIGLFVTAVPIVGMITGIVLGRAVVGRPRPRSRIIVGTVIAQLAAWLLVLWWPVPTPGVLLALLAITLGVGGPVSVTAFDIARERVPGRLAARANGIVNTGGFSGALVVIWLTGAMLSLQGAEDPGDYSIEMFRIAYLPMLGILVVALAVFLVLNRRPVR
jgi:MFS family permease